MDRKGQVLTVGAALVGGIVLAGGLIFLCAATQDAARIPIAIALLLVGGGLAGWDGVRWRRARRLAPDMLDQRITDLASASEAEVTLSQLVSALDVPEDLARSALARREAQGLCEPETRQKKTVYVFPGLKPSKVARRCPYCGSEFSVKTPLHKCPQCGGNLTVERT